jgi:alpha,alpha-trehalase
MAACQPAPPRFQCNRHHWNGTSLLGFASYRCGKREDGMQSGDIGRGYRPIRDYGIIGDCHGNALVASDGGIDWCCLGRHDEAPVFFRLLDANKGGFWSIQPTAEAELSRRYRQGTNILETTFETAHGSLTVTDLMPVGRHVDAGPHDHVRLIAPFWLIRRVTCTRGSVEVEIRFRPSAGLDEPSVELELDGEAIRPKRGPVLFSRLSFELVEEGRAALARVTVEAGTTHDLVLAARSVSTQSPLDRVAEVTTITEAFWREWLTYNRYTGPHEEAVRRSALALKLLTYAPTGAIVAAATTSLPGRDRRRAQLGLPLQLAPRFLLHPLRAGRHRLRRRGPKLCRLPHQLHQEDPAARADHVRHRA